MSDRNQLLAAKTSIGLGIVEIDANVAKRRCETATEDSNSYNGINSVSENESQ